jgi:hypothetical protein
MSKAAFGTIFRTIGGFLKAAPRSLKKVFEGFPD